MERQNKKQKVEQDTFFYHNAMFEELSAGYVIEELEPFYDQGHVLQFLEEHYRAVVREFIVVNIKGEVSSDGEELFKKDKGSLLGMLFDALCECRQNAPEIIDGDGDDFDFNSSMGVDEILEKIDLTMIWEGIKASVEEIENEED